MNAKTIIEQTKSAIVTIRGQDVLLDADLATIYEVETRRLNEQVKRNIGKFPQEFRFQLTQEEFDHLMSQLVCKSKFKPKACRYPKIRKPKKNSVIF